MPNEKTIRTPKSRSEQDCLANGWARIRFLPFIECRYNGECDKKMIIGKKGTFCKQIPLESCNAEHASARHKSLAGKIFRRSP
jgi:hypothetical protein